MYLWLIIATFIAAIYALAVPIRSDMTELYVEPQAENIVTKLYVQHRAARTYLLNHHSDGEGNRATYVAGEIRPEDLTGYLPYGFNADSGITTFTSLTYCLDKKSPGYSRIPTDCSDPSGAGIPGCNSCNANGSITYLITFGCVPLKWRDLKTGKPNAMLLNAMKRTVGFTNGFGYVVDKSEITVGEGMDYLNTTMGIQGQGDKYYYPIPTYIINNTLSGTGNRSFDRVCGANRHVPTYDPDEEDEDMSGFYESCDYCLVYMTPF